MGFGMMLMLLFWVLVFAGIVALVRWLSASSSARPHSKNALDVLSERYARGEIDRREFEETKSALSR